MILARVVEHYIMLWHQICVYKGQYSYNLTVFQVLLCCIYEIYQSCFGIYF